METRKDTETQARLVFRLRLYRLKVSNWLTLGEATGQVLVVKMGKWRG